MIGVMKNGEANGKQRSGKLREGSKGTGDANNQTQASALQQSRKRGVAWEKQPESQTGGGGGGQEKKSRCGVPSASIAGDHGSIGKNRTEKKGRKTIMRGKDSEPASRKLTQSNPLKKVLNTWEGKSGKLPDGKKTQTGEKTR